MKNIILKISIFILALTLVKCGDPDNTVYKVFDDYTYGAILRTTERTSENYNIFDPNSLFAITIEEQDEQGGDLLDVVNVYVDFKDNTPSGVDYSKSEVLFTTIPASQFTTSANNLPTTSISATFDEVLTALNLAAGEYSGGDTFGYRLELVLTDGRTFSSESANGIQGSYFASPYAYTAGILCIPDSPITGDYVIYMQDSYGDGWQGSQVVCTIDGVEYAAFLLSQYAPGGVAISAGTQTITVPAGATSVEWSFVSGDWPSEVTFQIIGPNSGNVIGDFGPTPNEGPLALNLCDE